MTVDWATKNTSSNPPLLYNWMRRIQVIIEQFKEVTISHTLWEFNIVADKLSKDGLKLPFGEIYYTYFVNNNIQQRG